MELLEVALEYGIKEQEFWDMTFAEVEREIAAKRKVQKIQAQERASFDYILADLIGRSVSRIYSSSAKMPELNEAYPSLFDVKQIAEKKQEKANELSALRFKQFADSYNKRFKGGAKGCLKN